MSIAESDELPPWSLDARETGEVQKKIENKRAPKISCNKVKALVVYQVK